MLFKIAWRNIFKYRKRSTIVFLAIAFSIFVFIFAMGLIDGLKEMFSRIIFEDTGHIMIYKEGYYKKAEMLPIDLMIADPEIISAKIKPLPEIKAINQELKLGVMVIAGEKSFDMMARGIDISNPGANTRYRKAVTGGGFLGNSNEVLLGKPIAGMLGITPGKKVVLMTINSYGGINAAELTVSGLFETDQKEENENFVFISLSKARELLQIENGVSEITLTLKNPNAATTVIKQLKLLLKKENLEILPWQEVYKDLYLELSLFNVIFFILFLIVIVVVAIAIINILLISVFERIKDIGTMRAIGTSKKQVLVSILLESGLLGVSGSIPGIITGGFLVNLLSKNGINLGEAWQQFTGARILYPKFTMATAVLALALGSLVAVAGALYPGTVAVKLKPIKALYYK